MVTSTSRERGAERRAQLFNIHSVISLGWESKPFARCWCQFGRVHASLAGILRARPGHGWDRANFSGPLVDWTSGDHRCGQEGGISKQLSDKHRLCPEATWRHLHGTGGGLPGSWSGDWMLRFAFIVWSGFWCLKYQAEGSRKVNFQLQFWPGLSGTGWQTPWGRWPAWKAPRSITEEVARARVSTSPTCAPGV